MTLVFLQCFALVLMYKNSTGSSQRLIYNFYHKIVVNQPINKTYLKLDCIMYKYRHLFREYWLL